MGRNLKSLAYKMIELSISLSRIKLEEIEVKQNYEVQSIKVHGDLNDVFGDNYKKIKANVNLRYVAKGKPDIEYTTSTETLYSEYPRVGVLYIKQGGLGELEPEDIHLYADVPGELIAKVAQNLQANIIPNLAITVLVDNSYLVENYEESELPELKKLANFEEINFNSSGKVICAISHLRLLIRNK